jgi:hypothetical protein
MFVSIFGTSKSSKHVDDDLGNDYAGMEISIGQDGDNKLAPNQRKKIVLTVPRPADDATAANFRFGFMASYVKSDDKCSEANEFQDINFHIRDFDLSSLN